MSIPVAPRTVVLYCWDMETNNEREARVTAATTVRALRARKVGYTHLLSFTREFVSGLFAGTTHEDDLPFCNRADAEAWLAAMNTPRLVARNGYRVRRCGIAAL